MVAQCAVADPELLEIAAEYESGRLAELEAWIDRMLERNRTEIVAYYNNLRGSNPNISPVDALKQYIMENPVNLAGENRAQAEEMRKEIWYWSERFHRAPTEQERHDICNEWLNHYAKGWREHLRKEYCFVLDHGRERYEQIFHQLEVSACLQ